MCAKLSFQDAHIVIDSAPKVGHNLPGFRIVNPSLKPGRGLVLAIINSGIASEIQD